MILPALMPETADALSSASPAARALLAIKAAAPIPRGRIVKTGQVSANRWHLDVKLAAAGDIDTELLAWRRAACLLVG